VTHRRGRQLPEDARTGQPLYAIRLFCVVSLASRVAGCTSRYGPGLGYNQGMSDSVDTTSHSSNTTEILIEIIRADLKLGPEAVITEQTPLFGGDHDLDSLDALLLVTHIEKRFDIKIPNQDVGPDIFASVGHLARYIDGLRQ